MTVAAHTVKQRVGTMDLPAPGVWEIDSGHSLIGFEVRHLMLTRTRGNFRRFSGRLQIGDTLAASAVELTIDADSIDTSNPARDEHLRASDFLGADEHPTLAFRSTGITSAGGNGSHVEGELTIRGVTRPVVLEATFEGAIIDPWGNARAAFIASTQINREDWGITWNTPLENGGFLVGKEIRITLEIEATRVG